jgi:hypothetical protein
MNIKIKLLILVSSQFILLFSDYNKNITHADINQTVASANDKKTEELFYKHFTSYSLYHSIDHYYVAFNPNNKSNDKNKDLVVLFSDDSKNEYSVSLFSDLIKKN